jgi:hypothetical protein
MDVTIPCPCPPKADGAPRHEQDTVSLRAVMDFPTAVLLQKSIQAKITREIVDAREAGKDRARLSEPDVLALMSQFYVRNCIEAWTLVDAKGKPLEVTLDNIEAHLESHMDAALAVAEAAEDAYAEVTLPLVMRVVSRFVTTPTAQPTSPETNGSPKRPKPSKPSSISTIPTVVTGQTSGLPDGVSSSLPSSATAA